MSRLKDMYNSEIVDAMMKKFEYKNVMQVPKIAKIVVNMGVGEAKENAKALRSFAGSVSASGYGLYLSFTALPWQKAC